METWGQQLTRATRNHEEQNTNVTLEQRCSLCWQWRVCRPWLGFPMPPHGWWVMLSFYHDSFIIPHQETQAMFLLSLETSFCVLKDQLLNVPLMVQTARTAHHHGDKCSNYSMYWKRSSGHKIYFKIIEINRTMMQELWLYFIFSLVLVMWLQFNEKTLTELIFKKLGRIVLSSHYLISIRPKWKSCILWSSFDRTLNNHLITQENTEPDRTDVQYQK